MRCFTGEECSGWLRDRNIIDLKPGESPYLFGEYELMVHAPQRARMQSILAREMVEWFGPYESLLCWVDDWPFYKPEEMAILSAIRRASGETRHLIDARGHLFLADEVDVLTGFLALLMNYGWDGYFYPQPFRGHCFQTSHEDFVWMLTSDRTQFQKSLDIASKHSLQTIRRTEAE
ncbi:MAG: hypothetical protein FD161_2306 [Limisphaerales bacterium]|nr:MAG: hypothetical protein FD161_2306 [Limisphaerales bacterium]TXT50051.1 MAG: hypothetical protein FD140_2609 [Limisphaerales bacterium]